MKKLRMLSVCAGIGGAEIAAERVGAYEIVGQIENNPFAIAVLERRFPGVRRVADLKEVQGDEFGQIDIIVGGIPCQPHSLAGKRGASADERDLWPEFRRLMEATQPRWVVVENVPGLLTSDSGRFFGAILADMGTLRYRCGWTVYGACDVGAPHQRDRVFIVGRRAPADDVADASGAQWRAIAQRGHEPDRTDAGRKETSGRSGIRGQALADASRQGLSDRGDGSRSAPLSETFIDDAGERGNTLGDPDRQSLAVGEGIGGDGAAQFAATQRTGGGSERAPESGVGRDDDGFSDWLDRSDRRWPAPPGVPQYEWEPARTVARGFPDRNKRLERLGNAIVPAQIEPILRAIALREGLL